MQHYFILRTDSKSEIAPLVLFREPSKLKVLTSKLGWKIFAMLSEPRCPIDIAKELGVHEQKVYYYVKKLRESGLIEELKTEQRHGTLARFYQSSGEAFGILSDSVKFRKLNIKSPQKSMLLRPFIENGVMNATVIVGSPDPHGPYKARASDASCAIDLAFFLGAYTTGENPPNYKLDTEVREDTLKGNMVLIGGPTANMITMKHNKQFPIYIDMEHEKNIISTLSKKTYTTDETGIVSIIENPENPGKMILLLAGKRFAGTRAAVLAVVTKFEEFLKGNKFGQSVKSRVVKGYDMDGDGIIDTAEFLE
ncbi:MAG: ArsR family transcriptional regulator [Candidatus Aenigmarchaeota archaeon]|nr:ArsR family transcriptional regulator [Candidatus Aenigmarchaeota archaeon]